MKYLKLMFVYMYYRVHLFIENYIYIYNRYSYCNDDKHDEYKIAEDIIHMPENNKF